MGTLGQIKTSRLASFKAIVRGHDLLSYRYEVPAREPPAFPEASPSPALPMTIRDEMVECYAFVFCQGRFRRVGKTFEQFQLVVAAVKPSDLPATAVKKGARGGDHGVLITAPSLRAFKQGVEMTRMRGTCALVGLPPGEFPIPSVRCVGELHIDLRFVRRHTPRYGRRTRLRCRRQDQGRHRAGAFICHQPGLRPIRKWRYGVSRGPRPHPDLNRNDQSRKT
jgi:hypothetical protein